MKILVLAIVLALCGSSSAQVFKPRGKGPLLKKVDLKGPVAAPVVAAAPEPKATPAKKAIHSRSSDVTPTPTKKRKVAAKKHKKSGDDDDDVKVSDDDDDVKVSDD